MRFVGTYERVKELHECGFLKRDIEQGFASSGLSEEQQEQEGTRQVDAARAIQKIRRGSLVRASGPSLGLQRRLGGSVSRRDSTINTPGRNTSIDKGSSGPTSGSLWGGVSGPTSGSLLPVKEGASTLKAIQLPGSST
jgi:hypothetical protein